MQSPNLAHGVLAVVSGEEITLDDLPAYLRMSLVYRQTVNGLIEGRLIEKACEEMHIEAEEDELDNFVDSFRETHRLFSVAETQRWLIEHDITYDDLYSLCEEELKLGKLKEKLAEGELEKAFAFRKLEFDSVELYKIVLSDELQVMEILSLLKEGADFFGLAKSYSQDDETRRQCGYMGVVRRRDLRPEVEACVFAAKEGTVAGPVKTLGDYHLYQVERFCPAILEGDIRQFLLEEIFERWMRRQIAAANIVRSSASESLQDDYND